MFCTLLGKLHFPPSILEYSGTFISVSELTEQKSIGSVNSFHQMDQMYFIHIKDFNHTSTKKNIKNMLQKSMWIFVLASSLILQSDFVIGQPFLLQENLNSVEVSQASLFFFFLKKKSSLQM